MNIAIKMKTLWNKFLRSPPGPIHGPWRKLPLVGTVLWLSTSPSTKLPGIRTPVKVEKEGTPLRSMESDLTLICVAKILKTHKFRGEVFKKNWASQHLFRNSPNVMQGEILYPQVCKTTSFLKGINSPKVHPKQVYGKWFCKKIPNKMVWKL